jgi:DNA repair protein SbcC/Rad50
VTELDLSGRNLIAIVGPTGSGKSSILDAMSYALYGKTARVKAGISRLVSSRAEAAHVRLTFSVDDRKWQVSRSLTRKGTGQHMLEDLDSGEKTVGAKEVTGRIEELLGLDFEAFTASVLLAQGQFSRFLEAATTERMKILKGVFRYDQIDQLRVAAKQHIAEIKLQLAEIEGERKNFPEDARAELKTARRQEKEWGARADELEKSLPKEKELRTAFDKAESEVAAIEQQAARALDALERIPPADEFESMADEEGTIESRWRDAETKSAQAADELDKARGELEGLEARLGAEIELRDALGAAKRLEEAAAEFARLEQEKTTLQEEVAARDEEVAAAQKEEEVAANALDDARAEQKRIEQAHAAHALRAHIAPGEPCPVCEQDVITVPKGKAPAALGSVAKKVTSAESALDDARKSVAAADKELDRIKTLVKVATKGLAKEEKRFTELDRVLKKTLGNVKDPVAEIDERLNQLGKAKKSVESAASLVEKVRKDLDAAGGARQAFAVKRQRLAATLVEIAARFDLGSPDIDSPADKLASHAEDARGAIEKVVVEARDSLEKARGARGASEKELSDLYAYLDLESDQTIAQALADARSSARIATKTAADLEGVIERAKELSEIEGKLGDRLQIYSQLADDMRNERFINFLLEDRRMLLSEIGSERLREMTGRYRFDDKGEFNVVDELDADKVREVNTLSGGETFLASLALALALAEAVARHGGRLQCFFIDEGFGSLDPESLDLALDGIEKIVGPDRLIGLVSHVAELGRRVEDKIVLDKSPEGTTIVVSGAA